MANPSQVIQGGSATLTWTSQYAKKANIDQGIGNVAVSGSTTVSPSVDTTYTITVTGGGGTASASVAVTVIPPPATVSGTVTDASTSQPVAGATVTATESSGSWSAQTDSTGGYAIDNITPGTVTFTFSKDGYEQNSTSDTLSQGQSYVLNAVLTPVPTSATLEGTVTLASTGQPVSGATVTVKDSTRTQSAQTAGDGSYTITGIVPGTVQVSVSYGSMFQTAQYTLPTAATYSQNFSMVGYATVTGTITDATTGAPIAGATVTVTDATGAHTTQTASDGTYTDAGISIGSVSVTASATGYASQTGYLIVVGDQPYTFNSSLYNLNATCTVQGVITNAKTLLPEPGVSVTLEGTSNSTVTDANGAYTLLAIPLGNQTFHVEKDGLVDVMETVYLNTTSYELNLIEPNVAGAPNPPRIGTSTSGWVTDAVTGAPLQGAIVRVDGTNIQTTTASDGSYTLSGLPSGADEIIAEDLDHQAEIMYPTVVSGGSGGCSFALPPTTSGTINGTVTDGSTGQPIRYATVSVGSGSLLSASTEADGTFTITGVPAGTYTVTAQGLEYLAASPSSGVSVTDGGSASVNFTLTRRPITGSLQGTIVDDQTNAAIAGAVLTVTDNGATATTDQSGAFSLAGLPAGLVTISISAAGYPTTTRTTRVMADQDPSTPTVTTAALQLDSTNPVPPSSNTKIITAAQGGSIETPDGRFTLVISPNVLSADASVTLQNPVNGPSVTPGAALTMDPALGVSGVVALGNPTELDIAPSVPGGPTPTLSGYVLILGQYAQSQADSSAVSESTAYPYYWDGQEWTVLQTMPVDTGVDPVNNVSMAVVNLSTTETGSSTGFSSVASSAGVSSAASSTGVSSGGTAFFDLGARLSADVVIPPTNVQINYGTGTTNGLEAVINASAANKPSPNALPLVIVPGWSPLSMIQNEGTDPNTAARYKQLLLDLVALTDGVYQPVFASYNSRASINATGADIASTLAPMFGQSGSIRGNSDPYSTNNGVFPYVDTFGFSMGGLVSRTYQLNSGMVHNMVIVGTPNHGAFGFVNSLVLPLWAAAEPVKLISPGTEDLLGYNDNLPCWLCGNPRLCELNRDPLCNMPREKMTLIAGTAGTLGFYGDGGYPDANDGVVPVSSVLCTGSCTPQEYQDDPTWSLFPSQNISQTNFTGTWEFPFTHVGSGEFGDGYTIGNNPPLQADILQGLSDWTVAKLNPTTANNNNPYAITYPTTNSQGSAYCSVLVDFNCHGTDINRVALVIYAQDVTGNWSIAAGNGVLTNGAVSGATAVSGTSNISDQVQLTASCVFPVIDPDNPSTDITNVQAEVVPLYPGQTTVSTSPYSTYGFEMSAPSQSQATASAVKTGRSSGGVRLALPDHHASPWRPGVESRRNFR